MTEETAEQEAARLREERVQKELIDRMQRTPEEVAAGVDPTNPGNSADGVYAAITASEIAGEAIPYRLPGSGKILWLKPLRRKVIREQFAPLIRVWPDVLQFGAGVRKPSCPGIDYKQAAEAWTLFTFRMHEITEEERKALCLAAGEPFEAIPPPPIVTPYDVAGEVAALNETIEASMPAICETIWLLAAGSPGVVWPRPETEEGQEEPPPPAGSDYLDDLLDELELPDLCDVLRALLYANGRFKGSTADLFAKP